MTDTQTWTTTGPTITTTTTNGSNPRTVVTHSGPSQDTTTTTTVVHTSNLNGRPAVRSNVASTSSSQTGEQVTPRGTHARGVPRDPAVHEHNPHHGLGETSDQHAEHSKFQPVHHWGLSPPRERILFYCLAIPSVGCQIASAVLCSWFNSSHPAFIGTFSAYLFLHWSAWWQTAVGMMQRASWVRDESNLPDRRQYLYLAVRLNRLMLPTAVIAFVTFVVAYVRRDHTHDIAAWLLFLLFFIFGTVFSVMNAYNNITWESDRLEYEEGSSPYGNTLLAILGIPSKPRPDWRERID